MLIVIVKMKMRVRKNEDDEEETPVKKVMTHCYHDVISFVIIIIVITVI
jgi:uncharacterized protein YprB with RNaseH-like and TPR domain